MKLKRVTVPGAYIQRTMSLLAGSTPDRSNSVRVLFYGQSITEQKWWEDVAGDLRERFPHANLLIENRAIGGFVAPNLIRTAEYDLYPFYPDLLIFHVYGGGQMDKWEQIIRNVRERTTAEILLWTHHDTGRDNDYLESKRIREIALKYDCGLIDVEVQWQAVLAERGLEPQAFLLDKVHLNEDGCDLLASLMKPFLVQNPDLGPEHYASDVRDISIDDTRFVRRFDDGSLELSFEGNRIDVIARPDAGTDVLAEVLVNGKHPGALEGAYALTRPSEAPHLWFPAVKEVLHQSPLVQEDWTLIITDSNEDASEFKFSVEGSVTGFDGTGTNTETFISDSGRVVIPSGDNWGSVTYAIYLSKEPMPSDFAVNWSVFPLYQDRLQFSEHSDSTVERVQTLFQGVDNAPRVLRLKPVDDGKLPISGFRVYRPDKLSD